MIDVSLYYPTLTKPYKKWSDKQLVTGSHHIFTCMNGNEYFTGIAADIAGYGELSKNFSNKVAVAANRGKNDVAAKDMVRLSLIDSTLNLANSVSQIANGEIQILVSSGIPMRKRPKPAVLTTPTNLVVSAGQATGQLITKIDRVKGARTYIVRYTLDPQTPASAWASVVCTTRRCVINDLQSGSKYWIMVGALGGNGQNTWGVAQLSPYVP
jgi:hypothetical protein